MNRSRARLSAAGLAVVLAALVAVMELAPDSGPLRLALRDGFGPEGGASSRSVRLLRQLGVKSASADWILRASNAPSSKAVANAFLEPEQWLVSVAIPEESLRDSARGILANPEGRGRRWERVAWVSVYEGRRLAFATRAGLRVHGSGGREAGREAFRLIFRPSYGLPHLPPGAPLETAARPPDRFIIRKHQIMPRAQPIAFEIARRIGAIAPSAVPARFVLNGSLRGEAYELTEQVSREGWGRSFFGHDDFRFFQFRGSHSSADEDAYRALREWVRRAPPPLLLAQVAELVDEDRFLSHILTIMYCGTNDWAQGGAVLNLRSPRPRWFWVHWDLDQSFEGKEAEPWKRRSIGLFLAPSRPGERSDVRALLFQRLLREDREFVSRFTEVVSEKLNHSLTAAYLQDLVRRNEPLSADGIPFGGYDLHAFFAHRGDAVFDAVADALGRPRPHVVDVRAPSGVRLHVDGHEYQSPYRGRYFEGQTFVVRALDSDGRPRGLWRVNGRETVERELKLVVDRDTSISLEG